MPKIKPLRYDLLIKIFVLDGFQIARQRGDHIMMTKEGIRRPLVIKTSPKEVPVTHIKTNLTTAGLSRERYFELLEIVK